MLKAIHMYFTIFCRIHTRAFNINDFRAIFPAKLKFISNIERYASTFTLPWELCPLQVAANTLS